MADEMLYDYDLAESACADMRSISKDIATTCDDMFGDTKNLLQTFDGAAADEYGQTSSGLVDEITTLREQMVDRCTTLEQAFEEMEARDRSLAGGFHGRR